MNHWIHLFSLHIVSFCIRTLNRYIAGSHNVIMLYSTGCSHQVWNHSRGARELRKGSENSLTWLSEVNKEHIVRAAYIRWENISVVGVLLSVVGDKRTWSIENWSLGNDSRPEKCSLSCYIQHGRFVRLS